jgi:hypothetical protein
MAVSNISIANRALTLLGAERITAFDEESEQARKINAIFESTRDALLSEHNWNFARKERALSLLSDEPLMDDYTYAYQIPSDCIRVLRWESYFEFAIYGDRLYSNSTTANIEYISKITDPTKFSAGFVKAFAARLAADLAFPITQNATLAKNAEEIAMRDLKEAKWSDAQEGKGTVVINGTFLDERAL